jgi:hypothetical protein
LLHDEKKLSLDTFGYSFWHRTLHVRQIYFLKTYMKKLKPKPHQFWAWCSTLTILAGAVTAALGFYPLYCYIFLLGNSGLAIVSWLWNEKSLVALNTGLASIYMIGLINLYAS